MKSPLTTTAVALLVLALGLAGWLALRKAPPTEEKKPVATAQATTGTKPKPYTPPPPTQTPDERPSKQDLAGTKLIAREESMSIRDLEKYGITVNADHVGKNSATGKVRISTKEGALLEADQAKMSPNGMLVAEGNTLMVHGEQRIQMGGENAAMAIYFDEEKQQVIVRTASADKVTKPFTSDEEITDPDRKGTR
jgi:hypothetical protein